MTRLARSNESGSIFHILVRSIDDVICFDSNQDRGFYRTCLDRASKRYGASIIGYCILPRYAHILLASHDSKSLSLVMTYANAEYAKWFNATKEHKGRVFCDRFKSESINSQVVLECLKFIHNSPLRVGEVEDVGQYQLSSYIDYINGNGIVDFAVASKHFNPSSPAIKSNVLTEKSSDFLDIASSDGELVSDAFEHIIDKYNLHNEEELRDPTRLKEVASEIISLTGMSIRQLSSIIGVNREKLRRVLKGK